MVLATPLVASTDTRTTDPSRLSFPQSKPGSAMTVIARLVVVTHSHVAATSTDQPLRQ